MLLFSCPSRMEAVKRSLRLAQQRLEESIRLKEERVQLRVLEEDVQRVRSYAGGGWRLTEVRHSASLW